jgi:hypothetical protein
MAYLRRRGCAAVVARTDWGADLSPRPLSAAASHSRRTSECAWASRILSNQTRNACSLIISDLPLVTVLDAAQHSPSVTGRSRQQTNQVPTKPFPVGHEVSLKRTPPMKQYQTMGFDHVGSHPQRLLPPSLQAISDRHPAAPLGLTADPRIPIGVFFR